jgi:hypothetical protein
VVTTEKIEQAFERLKAAGLWAQERNAPDSKSISENPEGHLFHGAAHEPEAIPGEEDIKRIPKHWFSVWYQKEGTSYIAAFLLGQIWVHLHESEKLDAVISAIINYFEIKNVLPDPERLRWGSVTDPDNGLINTIFWLQRAGAVTEIVSEIAIRAIFPTRTYTIQFTGNEFSLIEIEGAEGNFATAQTLEDVTLNILAHQCKYLTAKVEDS